MPSSPSADLLARFAGTTFEAFDQCSYPGNSRLIDTFSNLPPCITSATLTMRLKPCGDMPDNDAIDLSFTGGVRLLPGSWSSYIGSDNGSAVCSEPAELANAWTASTYPNGQVITLDLSNLQPGTGRRR